MAVSQQTVNEHLMDAAIRHQIGLQRLSTATVRKIVALLNRVDADIVRQLQEAGPGARTEIARRRLEHALEAIRDIMREAYGEVHPTLRAELTQVAAYEADFNGRLLQEAIPMRIDLVTPTAEALAAAVNSKPFEGKILREWTQELEDAAYRKLRDQIRIGFTQGETIDQMVRRVRGTKARQYKDGILDLNRRNAEAVVRTAVAHTANASREELYAANSDLIKGVVWVSTLDTRTTPICRARDGKVFEVGKGPRPPAHWNCRSSTTPLVKSWQELGIDLAEAPEGTRASMNGQVPAETTYGQWLRRQDKGVVEEVLGKKKAKLFLDGNLPIDRFVDDKGMELTLDELREREAAAFTKAGMAA